MVTVAGNVSSVVLPETRETTSGAVSVVDTLPTGLVATAMTGAGWTVNLATLTATRSDPLGSGASYSPLTLTVNVAANAPAALATPNVASPASRAPLRPQRSERLPEVRTRAANTRL